jgi:hypothetical protein
MAEGSGNPGGGGKAALEPREHTIAVIAAPLGSKTQRCISASIVSSPVVVLTIRDSHTGQAVPGAIVHRIEIDGTSSLDWIRNEIGLPDTPPNPENPFTSKNQSELATQQQKAEKATGKTRVALEKSIKALLAKRAAWAAFFAYMQALARIISRWKELGEDSGYHGPSDGSGDWNAFEDRLGKIYTKFVARPYTAYSKLGPKGMATQITRLRGVIDGPIACDAAGRLRVPVPAGKKGTLRIEMKHLKLLTPKDAAKMGDVADVRAEYTLERGKYDADKPGSTIEASAWKLVSPAHTANLRNFIELSYDGTRSDACTKPELYETYAMVWCQPVWFEPGPNQVVFEPEMPGVSPKHGQKNGRPTLTVSSSTASYGRWYGSWTDRGRNEDWNWSNEVLGDEDDNWYYFPRRPKAEQSMVWWSFKKAEVELFVAQHYGALPIERRELTINQVKVKEGQKLQLPEEEGEVTVPKDTKVIYAAVKTFAATLAKDKREALIEAARLRIFVSEFLTEHGETGLRLWNPLDGDKFFDTSDDVPSVLRVPKAHHGVDCAANVGDPAFAVVGGALSKSGYEIYRSKKNKSGLVANVSGWRSGQASFFQFVHMRETYPGTVCKAGDVLGPIGRTGNPDGNSPTHVHFMSLSSISLERCVIPGYEAIFPHNAHPKLLPCGADWWTTNATTESTTPPSDNNADELVARRCRALPHERENAKNVVWKGCWAMKEGVCPHKDGWKVFQESERKKEEEAKEAQRLLREAEKKRKQEEAAKKKQASSASKTAKAK